MKKRIKVVSIVAEKKVTITEQDVPDILPDEVLIKVFACMICTWEQRIFTRLMPVELPFAGGHEFSGVIEAIGKNVNPADFPVGARCAAMPLSICGICEPCRRGDTSNCIYGYDKIYIPGKNGFAEYILLDKKRVFIFPDDVPFERIMFLEPLSCIVSAHDKFRIEPGDDVAVLGAGVMGILNGKLARLQGARVIISDPDPQRRKKALDLGVCDFVIDPLAGDPAAQGREIIKAKGFNVVINTAATAPAITQGIGMLAPGGTFLMYGKVFPNEPVPIDINYIQNHSMRIAGTIDGDVRSFNRAQKILAHSIICPEKMGLLTNSYDASECQKAFEEAIKPESFRVCIKFGLSSSP